MGCPPGGGNSGCQGQSPRPRQWPSLHRRTLKRLSRAAAQGVQCAALCTALLTEDSTAKPQRTGRVRGATRLGLQRATVSRSREKAPLEEGVVYHTYSAYSPGVDALWNVWQWLDRAPSVATRATCRGCGATRSMSPVTADVAHGQPAFVAWSRRHPAPPRELLLAGSALGVLGRH